MPDQQLSTRSLFAWFSNQFTKALTDVSGKLKDHTFSVTVENQPDMTELLKEVAQNTRGLKGKLDEVISKPIGIVELTKQTALAQRQEPPAPIKFPEYPKSISVSNLKDIVLPKIPTPEKVDTSVLERLLDELKSAFQEVSRVLPSLKSEPVKIPPFPEQKPFPKSISIIEGKDIEDEIKGLRADFEELYKLIKDKEFGNGEGKVEVTNFPPQHIPTPVTNISINSLRGVPVSTKVSVTTSPTKLPANALSQRRSMILFNNSGRTVYLGGADVTVATGFPVSDQSYSPPIDAGEFMFIYGIATGTSEVRVLEVSSDNEGN